MEMRCTINIYSDLEKKFDVLSHIIDRSKVAFSKEMLTMCQNETIIFQ